MATINLPFAASATKRAPDADELANGFGCGDADLQLFDWLAWWETAQIANVISKSGLLVDDTDVSRLAAAIRSQRLNYIPTVSGTANALTLPAALDPALPSHIPGLPLRVMIALTNTGPATLDIGLGALPIVTPKGSPIARGDLTKDSIVTLICTGTAFMLAGIAYSEVPIIGAPTIWVRTDGNDANDGSANTAGSALATITEATNRTKRYFGSSTATIRLGNAGTYAAPNTIAGVSIPIEIIGDVANQSGYIVAGNGLANSSLLQASGCRVRVEGVTFDNRANISATVGASSRGTLSVDNCRFANTVVVSSFAHVWSAPGSLVEIGNSTHIGTAAYGWFADAGVIAMVGSMTSSMGGITAFVWCRTGGSIVRGSGSYTWSSTTTGVRYLAELNGVINTGGGGANFFPGNAAGSVASGGQYA